MIKKGATIVESLELAAKANNKNTGYFFRDKKSCEQVTFKSVWERSLQYANFFNADGVEVGEHVALSIPTGPEFAYAFFGIMLCGAVPVAVAPASMGASRDFQNRLDHLTKLLNIHYMVIKDKALEGITLDASPVKIIAVNDIPIDHPRLHHINRPAPRDVALIQATSGSTGRSKAVPLTHNNLISNFEQMGSKSGLGVGIATVCWLPLYHDFGLIGQFLLSLYWGMRCVLIPPLLFLKLPHVWLESIEEHSAQITASPNFGLAYAVDRVSREKRDKIDLSSLKMLVLGAESINTKTLRKFYDYFKPTGFRFESFKPAYGGAESCVLVTMNGLHDDVKIGAASRFALTQRQVIDSPLNEKDRVEFISCGSGCNGATVEVRDENGNVLSENQIGYIWWKTPSLTTGYIADDEENEKNFVDGWFNSGDQGYISQGDLYVTGRYKEVIIIRGQNYLPYCFEAAAATVPGAKEGRVIAFGQVMPNNDGESLVLVCGIDIRAVHDQRLLSKAVMESVSEKTGIRPERILFISDKQILRTTSGKLQRLKTKQLFQHRLNEQCDTNQITDWVV